MKEIRAIIRHEQLEMVRDALDRIGIKGITITDVKGAGQQSGFTESYRGAKTIIHFRPKLQLSVIVPDDKLEEVVEVIISNARTGEIGDGKVFIFPVEEVIRIRTGEKGLGRI